MADDTDGNEPDLKHLLDEHLPSDWDDSPSREEQITKVVRHFLQHTDPDSPIHERRKEAQTQVADEVGVRFNTIQSKTGRETWEDHVEKSSEYQRKYFDSALEKIENKWNDDASDDIPPISELEIGKKYYRNELHDKYGGNYNSGISPSADHPYVFIFTGDSGDRFGYEDGFEDDTFIYTGEGQEGDMEMSGYNRAIRDHQKEGRELHLFRSIDEAWGIIYLGQFRCDDWRTEELPDRNGNMREAIRFELTPLDDPEKIKSHLEDSPASTETTNPSIFQAPIKSEGGPIRENYEKTVLADVPRDHLESICDIPVDHQMLRVWGNGADEAANSGDYLLFADRDGRYDGEYSLLAKIESAQILDESTAEKFSDTVGWRDSTDRIFPHVMFLGSIYEVDLDREKFWNLLGFKGWPNDTYSPINFGREESDFFEAYDSVEEFIDRIKSEKVYPTTKRYFWLNTGVEDWQHEGGEMFCTATNKQGSDRRNREAFERASPGDNVVIYHMFPEKQIVGRGRVIEGLHEGYVEFRGERTEGITVEWEESLDGPSWDTVTADSKLYDCEVVTSDNAYYLTELTEAEYNRILDLAYRTTFSDYVNELAVPTEDITVERGDLYFPDDEWQRIKTRIRQALVNGNHVLLFGPPGTGKTKLARQVCAKTVGENGYELVTASADWSTFDTVGGYRTTSENRLAFEPGVVLDRFHADEEGTPANEWLVIDELNRADIDKAFGSLFSALTGESVTLPFDGSDGEPIEILDASRDNEEIGPNHYYIPNDWRMLATINTLDKTSLYEMSYAFMRRWAFIPVGIPDLPEPRDDDESELVSLIESYVKVWAADDSVPEVPDHYEPIGRIWRAVNEARAIGPAIVEDIYEHVASGESEEAADYVSPIIMYVFPQLEGLRRDELERLIERLDTIVDDESGELWHVARDFFQVDLQPGGEE